MNPRRLPEELLPEALTPFQAVEAAYPEALARVVDALRRGLAALVECPKGLTPYVYKCVRDRLKSEGLACTYLDGRGEGAEGEGALGRGLMAGMVDALRDAVRGAVDQRVIVLPHLDLLTSSTGTLTTEAREVISLMYENPSLQWLGFRDPSFPIPRVVTDLFPHRVSLLGLPRERLAQLVTRREARKLGRDGLDVYGLYSHVSGLDAVRLRNLLGALQGEDHPVDPSPAWRWLREATVEPGLSLPDVDLERDLGGYAAVKKRIRREILDVVHHTAALDDPAAIERAEALVPRGIIFWGPPGTGKTLFAKAMATALGAAVQVISGPELKSRWVGESEARIRQVFLRARQSAPSLIIFDELDAFASARGTYTGSGVEHSMVNQLLTELDGFRANERVFVVGTTNLVEALDPALLRPGRFEFQLHVPYPDAADRDAILEVHDRKLGLEMTDEARAYAVRQSAAVHEGGTPWSGDHLQALGRALARRRLRDGLTGPTTPADVDAALTEHADRPSLTAAERYVVATHEAGHAVCALHCPHMPSIDRISIRSDVAGALGFVRYADPAHRYVVTRGQLLDLLCTLFGGREAERLLLADLSVGSAHDLRRATEVARDVVGRFGMGPDDLEVRDFGAGPEGNGHVAEPTRARVDAGVRAVLEEARARAEAILTEHHGALEALRDLLLTHEVLDASVLATLE